jgi:hypothetical protein
MPCFSFLTGSDHDFKWLSNVLSVFIPSIMCTGLQESAHFLQNYLVSRFLKHFACVGF